jgi:putative ABC transport system substrate-binding protein
MRRRDLLLLSAGVLALRPLAGLAQQPRRRLIGYLGQGSRTSASGLETLHTFREGLAALGWSDDKLSLESRWADGYTDRMPALAAELVRLSPDVILASSGAVAAVVKQATATIPIVFAVSDDPAGTGLVASLAHPGGNLTGLSFAQEDTVGRELQLLKTMAPAIRRVAVLINPASRSSGPVLRRAEAASGALQIAVIGVEANAPEMIAPAFAKLRGEGADAVLVLGDGLFTSERKRLIVLAAENRLPAIYHDHIFVEDSGLMSYGGDFVDNYRGAAVLVDKILKGAKPGDLPVQEPTKFYLYINRKTSAALDLEIPPLLEAQADKIIE